MNGFKWCINLYEKGTRSRRVKDIPLHASQDHYLILWNVEEFWHWFEIVQAKDGNRLVSNYVYPVPITLWHKQTLHKETETTSLTLTPNLPESAKIKHYAQTLPPPPPPHTHTHTHTHPPTHCSSFVYTLTFSQHLSYVLYTFGKLGPFSNWGPYCSFCYKSPVWMPKQTHTHTHSCLWPYPPRTSIVFSFVA